MGSFRWFYPAVGFLVFGLLLGLTSCGHSPHSPHRTERASSPRTNDTDTIVRSRRRSRHHRRMRHRRKRRWRGRRRRSYDSSTVQQPDTSVDTVAETTNTDTVLTRGRDVYRKYCSSCHGADRSGNPPRTPSLRGITDRLSHQQILDTINQGPGRMPSFDYLSDEDSTALLKYLSN